MDEVSIGIGVTLNLGNFESVRLDVTEKRTIKPGEDPDEVRDQLYDRVDEFIGLKVQEVRSDAS